MTIAPETGGTALSIPYAPQKVDHTDLGSTWIAVSRPGLPDYYVWQKANLPQMNMPLVVADKAVASLAGRQTLTSAYAVIRALQNYARKSSRVRVSYGAFESGLWNLVEMTMKSTRRDPVTDEITYAEVNLQFVRADSSLGGTGPVTGGAVSVPVGGTIVTAPIGGTQTVVQKAPGAPAARYYTTKSGDTLWAISYRYYGTGDKWKTIADINGIKDPRKLTYPKKLRIP
jgi:LysM repeat protein